MKTLLVYYSHTGGCGIVAEQIQEKMNATVLRLWLADEQNRTGFASYFWGGLQVLTHEKPALQPYTIAPKKFDLIIIGTPVWAGSPAPALRTFLEKTPITGKKIALFCCYAGNKGKVFKKLEKLLPNNTFLSDIDFANVKTQSKETIEKSVNEWVKKIQR
ncbi:flavodoxin [Spirochaetia bacterium]|nr:flavodoxin [Spirochaetia bacterium]GHU29682.1 flavodoxin [Spirochaetia bacterium]